MWELASLLNFLHVFRPMLKIEMEFSAEELETALITPNSTLDGIHIPLLKAIPPVIRMALGHATWITVLCRKLKDWWHWVAEGEPPIFASHGMEIETYKTLDPGTRVLILKALCDIRVEQEDIRNYIENSLKQGIQLSTFRREKIGGDSHGITYWYEGDPLLGYRLYREIRQVEVKKVKSKGVPSPPVVSYQWETIATNLDEFQEVSDKLFSSKNRTEAALGKRLKIGILPEIEKIHKKKEKLLKKQHRQALLLDSFLTAEGLSSGRALRDRKPVTYTFDDYDRSISEAIKITKVEPVVKPNPSTNEKWSGPPHIPQLYNNSQSPKSDYYEEIDGEHQVEPLDRSNRRRKRPQRYSEEFVEAVPDEFDFDSDDDIVGEAVYDEEYLRNRKQRKVASSSDGDEEYRWEDENADDDEVDDDTFSNSEDRNEHHQPRKFPRRSRRGMKMRSVDELQAGLRRSKRSTRQRVNYRQYAMSDTEEDTTKPGKSNPSNGNPYPGDELEMRSSVLESQHVDDNLNQGQQPQKSAEMMNSPEEEDNNEQRRFLDLNELAPVTSIDGGSRIILKDEDVDSFLPSKAQTVNS
ncbi:hypothetical protein J5N97_011045 [Dioscorea zingiberensis]|uniref:DDT domain-containing protein n=1 Tax=Dioscorea zingiberensis TaxID=325984 RepID=A0A9D5CZK0_9LILI|nr:hypothetical protein J5N97_011045 [Dioscorea zingiberensis]